MKVHIFRDGETLSEFDLAEGEYLIGSGDSAHLRLPGDSVAPEHARLKIGAGGVEVEDLGSGRGTFLGELALTGAQPLPNGAILQCGDVGLQFRDDRSSATAAPGPAEQGRYVIGEIVAKGAMGVIRCARELSTGREVAMKQMHEEFAAGSAAGAARFVQEAKITAHLEHPNVVPVHDVGHGGGGPSFYTMKMVRGVSLEKVLELLTQRTDTALKKYPLEALLTIFQKVCDALAFAHSKGIIHRDLKPANLMVGEYGEVLVMDWGLAKLAGEAAGELPAADPDDFTEAGSSSVTLAGTVMGTPYYMAPEQAAGDIALVDERSDIYALGAILYELLTLQTSVEGRGSKEVLQKVRDGKITPILRRSGKTPLPHLPGGKIPASLAAVAMKALAYSPGRRYQRVTDLQAEIRAFQSGFATSAEGAGTWRQLTLLVKRHKAVATALAASVALLGVLTAISATAIIRESKRANVERDRAKDALAQVEPERDKANAALAQSILEKKRAEEALAQAESEGQRANLERDRATEALTKLQKTAPTFAEQAQTLIEQQKSDEALEKIGFAISLDPKNPNYLLRRANWLQARLKLDEAVLDYRQALELGDDPTAARNLSLCEKLLQDNKGRAEWLPGSRGELYDALLKQGRALEAVPLGKLVGREADTAEASIRARLQPLGNLPKFEWSRIRRLPNGTFDLTFGQLPITDIPDLSGLPVTRIYLDNTKLTKIPSLKGLPLEVLCLNGTPLSDLNGLQDLPLKRLELYGTKVSDLRPLRGLPLTQLYVSNSQVSDLSPVADLPTLETLDLQNTACADLAPLRGLKLRTLWLNGTQVRDLSALRGLPIEELRLDSTAVTDIAVLESLPLKRLTIYDCKGITDFQPLGNCKQLEALQLRKTSRDISFLHSLPNLQRLTDEDVPRFSFEKIPAAAAFWKKYDVQFAAINAVRAAVAKLCPGADKAKVSDAGDGKFSVDASNLPLRDFGPLHGLPIRELSANQTAVSDLSALAGMEVETLWLMGCKMLTDISPLAKCPKLKVVNFSETPVRDLSSLKGLRLTSIALSKTASDLSPLRGMPLVGVFLDPDGPAYDVSPLADCPKVERIVLAKAARNVEELRKLPALKYISYRYDFSVQRPAQTAAEFWAEFDRQKAIPPK